MSHAGVAVQLDLKPARGGDSLTANIVSLCRLRDRGSRDHASDDDSPHSCSVDTGSAKTDCRIEYNRLGWSKRPPPLREKRRNVKFNVT